MLTTHKLFSSKMNKLIFTGALTSQLEQANTRADFVDLALPGMLPVLNEECLDLAVRASLALRG